MFTQIQAQQKQHGRICVTEEHSRTKPLQTAFSKKLNPTPKLSIAQQNLLLNKQNELITVPIKEYSNKFLRQKKKQEQQSSCSKKKQPFPSSHLYHNRKLISEFKKYKGKSQKFRNGGNKENGEFVIYNLLFEKGERVVGGEKQRRTIFGTFTENFVENPKMVNEQSMLFEKGWKTTKNGALFQARKEVYDRICEKEKSVIPEHRKKCKTLVESTHYDSLDNQKKLEKISTSRALQKYSKIIKVNPEHGKIQKMKIKKELAKSLRFQSCEKSEIQTKQITLAKKQVNHKIKHMFMRQQSSKSSVLKVADSSNKQNEVHRSSVRTPQQTKDNNNNKQKESFISSKVGIFSSAIKFKRLRKFSHQVGASGKKCVTEQRHEGDETFDDFEINGWDINF